MIAEANQFEGAIPAGDVAFLRELARTAPDGVIVEIGAFRGKSTVALASGSELRAKRAMVYSIEPHAEFVGVYGGRFGPADRAVYYKTMLDAGCAEHVGLINLPSVQAARGWEWPIGLLFIDGDHRPEPVRADAAAWLPFVVSGGIVAFDDARDQAMGPHQVITELLAGGGYDRLSETSKIIALRKL